MMSVASEMALEIMLPAFQWSQGVFKEVRFGYIKMNLGAISELLSHLWKCESGHLKH